MPKCKGCGKMLEEPYCYCNANCIDLAGTETPPKPEPTEVPGGWDDGT